MSTNKTEDILNNLEARLASVERQIAELHDLVTIDVHASNRTLHSRTMPHPIHDNDFKIDSMPELRARKVIKKDSPPIDSSWVLGIIGIVFVILAGVFFIKITIDSGWLTPMRQILLASATGLAFFLTPNFFPKTEKEYGALLAGSGTTILHLTWLGGYFYHHVLSANTALVCATFVGIFSVAAKLDKGNRLYVLIAMAGTYFSAPIVGYSHEEITILSIFLIIWNLSFSATALMYKHRSILFIASYYAVFTVLMLSGYESRFEWRWELLILQLIQFAIFSSALMAYSVLHRTPLTKEESFAIFPLLILFYVSSDALIYKINAELASWYGMIVGTVILGIYFLARKLIHKNLYSGPPLTAFASVAYVHSIYFQLLDETWKPLAGLLIGLAVMFIWNRREKNNSIYNLPLLIFLSTFFYGAILTIVGVSSIKTMFFYNWSYGLIAFLTAIFGPSLLREHPHSVRYGSLLLGFAHFEVMLGLYRLSQHISWSGALFVSITWGIYALAVLGIAFLCRDKNLGKSALTILLAVSLKAFFYDLINTSHLIRVLCLLVEGMLLYGCGWIFKKIQLWSER